MDEYSLQRLEFPRVVAAVAARAQSEGASALLRALRPFTDAAARAEENATLAEAIRRQREPEEWCQVGPGALAERLEEDPIGGAETAARLDGPGLVEVLRWLEAAAATRAAWADPDAKQRFPWLAGRADSLPALARLQGRLATALEPDGRVSDAASPALRRARAELGGGERTLQQKLERWAQPYGEGSYVTRHGDRFVALVPAAGFPRRRGIVHDVSGSGQSLFVEPLEACEANNRLIELRGAVQEEERRVLVELAEGVRAAADDLLRLEAILVGMDSHRARARWALDHGGIAIEPRGERLRLESARHPLLAMGSRREGLVPLDLDLEPEGRLLLVSGPNMGGKTVLLKTAGLAVALAHSACPVLAGEGSAVPEVDAVIVDLGDEQSLDQGLSTFAAHLRSLAAMAAEAGPRTLLLCDELGAGTDPEEGASLGRALIEHFAARGAWGIMTTHLGSLKRIAGEVAGVVNGSLEFDARTMTPRFRFLSGIPGASHALTMAERLGFDAGVIARARAITPEESRALERLIEELHAERERLREREAALAAATTEAERAVERHHAAEQEARRGLEELRRRLTRESEVLLSHARELWQTIQREARKSEKTRAGAAEVRERVRAVEREVESLEADARAAFERLNGGPSPAAAGAASAPSLRVGSRVRVVDLGVEAEVVAAPDAEGKIMLRRGNWNINTHVSRLSAPEEAGRRSPGAPAPVAGPAAAAHGGSSASWNVPEEAPPLELDLRGMEVDEALKSLDHGLDRAVLTGLSGLKIVHGVGKGVLRAAVERHLRDHPQVASQRAGEVGEGGRGVTVARLR